MRARRGALCVCPTMMCIPYLSDGNLPLSQAMHASVEGASCCCWEGACRAGEGAMRRTATWSATSRQSLQMSRSDGRLSMPRAECLKTRTSSSRGRYGGGTEEEDGAGDCDAISVRGSAALHCGWRGPALDGRFLRLGGEVGEGPTMPATQPRTNGVLLQSTAFQARAQAFPCCLHGQHPCSNEHSIGSRRASPIPAPGRG